MILKLKSNKGITLISVIVYVIVLSVVIGAVSSIMKFFYGNKEDVTLSDNTVDEYTRFLAYMVEDANSRKYYN